jgi:hypothetical protein
MKLSQTYVLIEPLEVPTGKYFLPVEQDTSIEELLARLSIDDPDEEKERNDDVLELLQERSIHELDAAMSKTLSDVLKTKII